MHPERSITPLPKDVDLVRSRLISPKNAATGSGKLVCTLWWHAPAPDAFRADPLLAPGTCLAHHGFFFSLVFLSFRVALGRGEVWGR